MRARLSAGWRTYLGGPLIVLGLGELAARGLSFVAMAGLFRIVGPASFGLLETTLAVLMFGTLSVELGYGLIGAREVARRREPLGGLVQRVVASESVIALAIVILWIVVALLAPMDATLRTLMIGYAVTLLAAPFNLHWVFWGLSLTVPYSVCRILRQLVFLVAAFLLVRSPANVDRVWMAELAGVSAMGLAFLLAYAQIPGAQPVRPRPRLDRALFANALPIGISHLVWALRMFLPVVLLGSIAGATAVGYFGATLRILLVFQGLHDIYFTRIYPSLSRLSQDAPGRFARMLVRSTGLLAAPSILVAVAFTLLGTEAMRVIYGEAHMSAAEGRLLAQAIWLIPILGTRRHASIALIVVGRQGRELACAAVGLGILLGLILVLAPAAGAHGVVTAMLISELVAMSLTWIVAARKLSAVTGT